MIPKEPIKPAPRTKISKKRQRLPLHQISDADIDDKYIQEIFSHFVVPSPISPIKQLVLEESHTATKLTEPFTSSEEEADCSYIVKLPSVNREKLQSKAISPVPDTGQMDVETSGTVSILPAEAAVPTACPISPTGQGVSAQLESVSEMHTQTEMMELDSLSSEVQSPVCLPSPIKTAIDLDQNRQAHTKSSIEKDSKYADSGGSISISTAITEKIEIANHKVLNDSLMSNLSECIDLPETINQRLGAFENYSPASPDHSNTIASKKHIVPEIPLANPLVAWKNSPLLSDIKAAEPEGEDTFNTVLDKVILAYNWTKRNAMTSDSKPVAQQESALLGTLRKTIKTYLSDPEWTSHSLNDCIINLLKRTKRPKYLADALLDIVRNIQNERLTTEFTPPAPVLLPSHQKCLSIVAKLEEHMPGFEKYIRIELDRQVFKLKDSLPLGSISNLIYFVVALMDMDTDSNVSSIRLLIFKCLYYFSKISVPLVFAILLTNPNAIPKAAAVETHPDPLVRAMVTILTRESYNTTDQADTELKKADMFRLLKIHYGYFALITVNFDGTIKYCLDCIQRNNLVNVDYALILIAKRRGYEWAMKNIVEMHLVPMLNSCLMDSVTNHNDSRIATIVFTIASIVKTHPCETNVDGYLDIFDAVLCQTTRKEVQEAAVTALCQMSRFGYAKAYAKLAKWKPDYKISSTIKASIATFVHRKPKGFWFAN